MRLWGGGTFVFLLRKLAAAAAAAVWAAAAWAAAAWAAATVWGLDTGTTFG